MDFTEGKDWESEMNTKGTGKRRKTGKRKEGDKCDKERKEREQGKGDEDMEKKG